MDKVEINDKKVNATLSIDFRGQPLVVFLDGNLEGDAKMSGKLQPQIPGTDDLPFTATKDK